MLVLLVLGQSINAQNFKGIINANKNGEPIAEAHILPEKGRASYSDVEGKFLLNIPKDGTTITISYLGFKTIQKFVMPDEDWNEFLLVETPIEISGVLIKGNNKSDPVFSLQTNDYVKKIVQPRNVADLFNDINGFSLIKRGNYAIDPTFRATQYEQLNVQFDGGTKAMHACPNRMDPITTHVIPEEIEKIEIIKGPYTVRYGATFGGIVNLVTQKNSLL